MGLTIIVLGRARLGKRSGESGSLPERFMWCLMLTGLALFFLAPEKYSNTIEFNDRWLWVGWVAAVLVIPPVAPEISPPPGQAPLALLSLLLFGTSRTWLFASFDAEEMSGMSAALEKIPAGS
jgi:hypothetical protein